MKSPVMVPTEHDQWRAQVLMFYPSAFIQDESTPSALRERAIHQRQIVAFFLRPHSTGEGKGYIVDPVEVKT